MFVQNRVNEIRQEKRASFGYIPSEENPADMATRGLILFPKLNSQNFGGMALNVTGQTGIYLISHQMILKG